MCIVFCRFCRLFVHVSIQYVFIMLHYKDKQYIYLVLWDKTFRYIYKASSIYICNISKHSSFFQFVFLDPTSAAWMQHELSNNFQHILKKTVFFDCFSNSFSSEKLNVSSSSSWSVQYFITFKILQDVDCRWRRGKFIL